MKKSLDSEALRTIYKQYKEYLLPVGTVVVSLILFFYLIIPQIANFTNLQKQMKKENEKLLILKNNLNYLSNLDSVSLDSDFKIASTVLPKEKDFVGVLSAVTEAAGKASVSLGDYEFKVGDLSSDTKTSVKGLPFFEIDLNIVGNSSDLINFMKELQKTSPISEVIGGGTSGVNSFLTVRFYYAPLSAVSLKNDTVIKPISANEELMLKNLLSWNNLEQTLPIIPLGTASGNLNSLGPFQ